MKTKFTMMMAVIATFAISLNLHSSNEEVVFGAPAVTTNNLCGRIFNRPHKLQTS